MHISFPAFRACHSAVLPTQAAWHLHAPACRLKPLVIWLPANSCCLQPDQNLKWKVGREIGIVRQLNHPRINKLLGVVDSAERMFIILRHVAGGSLLDKVRAAKRLPEIEAASLVAQAAEGLIHCHTHQVGLQACMCLREAAHGHVCRLTMPARGEAGSSSSISSVVCAHAGAAKCHAALAGTDQDIVGHLAQLQG